MGTGIVINKFLVGQILATLILIVQSAKTQILIGLKEIEDVTKEWKWKCQNASVIQEREQLVSILEQMPKRTVARDFFRPLI